VLLSRPRDTRGVDRLDQDARVWELQIMTCSYRQVLGPRPPLRPREVFLVVLVLLRTGVLSVLLSSSRVPR
jgi:hypothetical protein